LTARYLHADEWQGNSSNVTGSLEVEYWKYYIYAFDLKKQDITAALSCPDEKTAKQVCRIVSRKMDMEYGTKGFRFGHTLVGDASRADRTIADLLGETTVYIKKKGFGIDDFESAEEQTKKFLCTTREKKPLDFQFMYFVDLALRGLPIDVEENATRSEPVPAPLVEEKRKAPVEEEDIADTVARLIEKGLARWVSQKEFLDENINSRRSKFTGMKFTKKTLERYRETNNCVLSKKLSGENVRIGMDKADNYFERSGHEKNKRSYRYQYLLLREFDKQLPTVSPSGEGQ